MNKNSMLSKLAVATTFGRSSILVPVLLLLIVLANGACSTSELRDEAHTANGTSPKIGSDYAKLIDYFSAGDTEFNGLNNNFEYRATLENSVVREASLDRQTKYYQWDQGRVAVEREKIQKEEREETKVFLSFFTPDHSNDNLTNTKTIWKIYLDVNGQRYEGKVKRLRNLLAELQSLYPYHTRWTTSYEISLPVATAAIETMPSTLTVTGPLGTRAVKFPAIKN